MAKVIYNNGVIKELTELNKNDNGVVAHMYSEKIKENDEIETLSNIHRDIVVKNKDVIFLKIPVMIDGAKNIIDVIINKRVCIIRYDNETLVEFLREKMSLYEKIDKFMVCLFLFQYFSFIYTEDLLLNEGKIDNLFEKAVYDGIIDNKEILEIKKIISKIKRYVAYYKSMITYLDEEFEGIELYSKVIFSLDNTMNLVENVEGSIYSCIDIYNSVLSNKMNKTMQLLTVITVSALPLTVITGIFGMNFESMPLLANSNGFYLALGVTLLIVFLEIIYFKVKKYI